jgi:dihydrofolate synthase / folylpolyglutamate synthase
MNYSETLEYLYTQLPMYHRIGAAAYKTDLNNTLEICSLLENPQNNFETIHIAGTNGKGSVSHFLASVFQEMGFKTGLYTSPHLKDFRERIRINGKMIPEDYVTTFVEKHKAHFDKIQPSFFEWTVGLAFDYFSEEKIDIGIIETGLGGRLDSTNVISPCLSVITNISYDHANLLGDSISKIAYEKAGIIKKRIPVVIGRKQSETKSVFFEKAISMDAELYYAEEYYSITEIADKKEEGLQFCINSLKKDNLFNFSGKKISSELSGIYQFENITTVVCALDILKNKFIEITEESIERGLSKVVENTGIMGRWQKISDFPPIYCDTGHNEDGIRHVIQQIQKTAFNKLHFVFGAVNDKEIDHILKILPKEADYYFCRAQIPRALDEKILAEKAKVVGLSGNFYSTVTSALEAAKTKAHSEDLIVVGGSNFVVAEVV